MDLFEYQARDIFEKHGVPVLAASVATTADEAEKAAATIGGKVVVKAQVKVGGRGKAGGVKLKGFKTGSIGKNAFMTFDDVELKNATFSVSGAMVYNASKGNATLCVLNLGGERHVFDGAFELKFPKPTENNALILLA